MISAVRRLERALVFERAELGVRSLVDDLVLRWAHASGDNVAAPEPCQFIHDLIIKEGLLLPSGPRAIAYLDLCRRDDATPDPDRLFRILLPCHR